jgi:hypothetical protein
MEKGRYNSRARTHQITALQTASAKARPQLALVGNFFSILNPVPSDKSVSRGTRLYQFGATSEVHLSVRSNQNNIKTVPSSVGCATLKTTAIR